MFMAEIYLWPGNIKAMAQTPSGKVPIRNGNRFAFDGTDQIDFEDAQENLYFSLPNDYAWAANDGSGENVVPVFRVFNTQQGKHYPLSSAKTSLTSFGARTSWTLSPGVVTEGARRATGVTTPGEFDQKSL